MFSHKLIKATSLFVFLAIFCVATELSAQIGKGQVPRPNNIVFIMLDDADYFDFGFTQDARMIRDAQTPNIDALRRNGRLYTQFRTASAICSPTRISLLTGCNPIRFGGIDAWSSLTSESGLPNTTPQLGTLMKLAGKKTGFYGKWHVGNSRAAFQPGALGFDRHCRYTRKLPGSPGDWSGRYQFVSESYDRVEDVDYIDRYFADEALNFIDDCKSSGEDFFLTYCPLSPHFPWAPPRDYFNRPGFDLTQDRGRMLTMMHAVDAEIGRLISRLRDHDLLENTMIVLTSDNGAPLRVQHPARRFFGSKGTLLDAGIHVPLIVSWPTEIKANSSNDSFLQSYDLLPTFAELGGLDPAAIGEIDGRSFVTTMKLNDRQAHAPSYWELSGGPTRVSPARWGRTQAYQKGDYKLVRLEGFTPWATGGLRLHNLREDPGERTNLAANPEFRALRLSMYREMLAKRIETANHRDFPEFVSSGTVIPYQPRLDVAERDMTLQFDLLISEAEFGVAADVYSQPGAQQLTLNSEGKLLWNVTGYDVLGNDAFVVLESKTELEPGVVYRVVLSVGGYKNDYSKIELFVDDVKQDDADAHQHSVFKLKGTTADSFLGGNGIVIDNARYSTLRLWRTEWD